MKSRRILAASIVIAALAAGLGFFWPFGRQSEVLLLPGVVEIQEVRLGSKIGGRVEKVMAREGTVVEPDEELVVLAAPELRAQEQQADARYKLALADLEKARSGNRPEEKQAADAALDAAKAKLALMRAGTRPEEIREAEATLESIKAELQLATEEHERAKKLLRQNAGAQVEYESSRMSIARNTSLAAKAKARLDLLQAGNRPEEIEMAEAEMRRAEANSRLVKAGSRSEDIAMAEARAAECQGKLLEIRAMLKETVIRAPERAFVDIVAVRMGDVLLPNQPAVRVLRADDLWVRVYVPETELGKLRAGDAVSVTVDGYPGRLFEGKVIHIAAESEFTPRNVQSPDERRHQVFGVKVKIEDPQGIFKSGMAATVRVPLH